MGQTAVESFRMFLMTGDVDYLHNVVLDPSTLPLCGNKGWKLPVLYYNGS